MPCSSVPLPGCKQVLPLKEHEKTFVEKITLYLEQVAPADAEIAKKRLDCLMSFQATIDMFPPIREAQILLGSARDDHQLVKVLLKLAPSSRLLHIPSRIQAVRSFLVTKYHTFSLLYKLAGDEAELSAAAHDILFSVMFTIMAEDVYFSCLNEPSFPDDMKTIIAGDLISFWDTGSELAMEKHFPALEALWKARNAFPPAFGTMDGNSEIFSISMDMGNDWHDFLINRIADDETKWALDEFLFGLSWEELVSVRSRLKRFGINTADFDEIHTYLGSRPAYSLVRNPDPRMLYDFYIDRKEAALLRKRLNANGPYKTLEEIYLQYRMNFWL